MTKQQKIIICLGAIIGGALWCAYALTATSESIGSASVVIGLVFSVAGFIALVLTTKRNKRE